MSYILDALKKSEGERVDNREVPDWKTSHQGNYTPTAQGPTRQQIVSISVLSGILVALLIGAGVWMFSGNSAKTELKTAGTTSSNNSESAVNSNMAATKPGQRINSAQFAQNSGIDSSSANNNKSTKTTFSKFSEVQTDAQQIARAKSRFSELRKPHRRPTKTDKKTTQEKPVVKKAGKGSVVFSDKPLSQTNSTPSKPAAKKPSKKRVKVVALSELPDNIRRSIPAIGFSGHVYSSEDPKQSSVMINGRKMKEGTSVSRDLVLEKITENGAQFSFKGYHFRLGALVDYQSNGR